MAFDNAVCCRVTRKESGIHIWWRLDGFADTVALLDLIGMFCLQRHKMTTCLPAPAREVQGHHSERPHQRLFKHDEHLSLP